MEDKQGQKSKSTIAKDLGVPLNTVSIWLKKALLMLINNSTQREKNTRISTLNDVETATLKWFKSARDKYTPISGLMLTPKAE